MPNIEIYYAHVCGLCTKALSFLRERNASFTAFAVEWDAERDAFVDSEHTRRLYGRCGETVDFVPHIFVGDHHIPGWRALEPMIESGEIDELIPMP